ncbi:MAG: hypothetical protein WCJ33_06920, partial [Pseudomonadota bacterium]
MQQSESNRQEFESFLQNTIVALPKQADAALKEVANNFYNKLPLVDIKALNPEEAAKIVMSAFELMQNRSALAPKIRINAGKTSTIIEILNDDMPFLVDSISAEIIRQGIAISRIIHPIVNIKRDEEGNFLGISGTIAASSEQSVITESFIRIDASKLSGTTNAEKLAKDIMLVLQNVRFAVDDWHGMHRKIKDSIVDIQKMSSAFRQEDINEVCDFLDWIASKNFVFLGCIEYDFYDDKGNKSLSIVEGSELGIFKADEGVNKPKGLEGLPPEILHFALVPQLIEITKAMRKSSVHRFVHMDYIGLKRFDKFGKVIGERRFLGLFTSNVYYQSTSEIPFIRRKIERVMARAGFNRASHDGKTLKTIIEFTPRDELFQFSEDELFDYAMGVLSLETRPGVRLFVRRDIFERYVSCIVFLPRERFSSDLREEIQAIVERSFAGKLSTFYTQMTDSPLARLQIIITTRPSHIPDVNIGEIEQEIARISNRWQDDLYLALVKNYGNEIADNIFKIYKNAFQKNYIHDHEANAAVRDIKKLNEVALSRKASLELFRKPDDAKNILHLKWYNPNEQVPLSEVMPILENTGFKVIDEQPYLVKLAESEIETIWIRDFILQADNISSCYESKGFTSLEESLTKIWQNETENDALNSLVLVAGFSWRETMLIRA